MLIQEFEDVYCVDMLKNKKRRTTSLIDWTTLPYQEMYETPDGDVIPIVWVDDDPVYNRDFMELDREDFIREHNTPSAGEMYDRYTSEFEFIEGADILCYYQKKAREEKAQLEADAAAAEFLGV